MFFHIKHFTRYAYSAPVFCEPMVIRLRPREDASQRLLRYSLDLWPQPAGVTEYLDLEGNPAACAWFEDTRLNLTITTNCVVETRRTNPFDYLLLGEVARLPVRGLPASRSLLEHYTSPGRVAASVREFGERVLADSGGETIPFLSNLTARIHEQCPTIHREEGDPWQPAETLERGAGACRDLTVLFNQVCRHFGIPARFVSGYCHVQEALEERYLHAWSEVFLPGAGWRGYDPSIGLAVADEHVALAAAAQPQHAAASFGTFRGTGVSSRLETQLVIRTSDEAAVQSPESAALNTDGHPPAALHTPSS